MPFQINQKYLLSIGNLLCFIMNALVKLKSNFLHDKSYRCLKFNLKVISLFTLSCHRIISYFDTKYFCVCI